MSDVCDVNKTEASGYQNVKHHLTVDCFDNVTISLRADGMLSDSMYNICLWEAQ